MTPLLRTLFFTAGLGLAAAPQVHAQAVRQAPSALDRPALMSAKARHSTLLSVASAGARLVAAGERGIILYSDDQGATWQQAVVPTSASVVALRFLDAKQGWAVGHMGVILHTVDGGAHWTRQLDGLQAAQRVADAARQSGDDRRVVQAEQLLSDGPDKPFLDLLFDDARNGWAVGAFNTVFRTTDGGKTWLPWQDRVDNPRGLHLYSLARVGTTLWIAGEQGLLLRSDDDGAHFVQQPSPYKGTWFGLLATREGHLLAYGLRGNVFVSTDAGASWTASVTGTPVTIAAATQLPDSRIVLVSQAGQVLVSADQGRHFSALPGLPGLPLAGVTAFGTDHLALASLRGVVTLRLPPAASGR